MLENLRANKS